MVDWPRAVKVYYCDDTPRVVLVYSREGLNTLATALREYGGLADPEDSLSDWLEARGFHVPLSYTVRDDPFPEQIT